MSVRAAVNARRQRAHDRARRDILLAAGAVLARRGFADATLADLAREAGYAPPSLYRYFSSKEEIYRSLVELILEELRATFDRPVDPRLPLADRLVALVRAQAEVATERAEISAFVAGHCGDAGVDRRSGLAIYEGHLAAWLRRHVRRGELRVSPALAARVLAGVLSAFFHAGGDAPGPAADARVAIDLVLHGVAAPGAPAPHRLGDDA
ncbi:MAG TPA: TetR/AcrR family transcriptional regulator [Anaeromyxobacteraceae bacterium]|nr:TetR/AcrR family transcriptional regulator [Anaeromyxobacteraceae bacterium]